jgi:hypothetical protein
VRVDPEKRGKLPRPIREKPLQEPETHPKKTKNPRGKPISGLLLALDNCTHIAYIFLPKGSRSRVGNELCLRHQRV